MKLWLVALALVGLTVSCDRNGAVGAMLRLRDDSPLPSWVVLPAGVARSDVSVKITAYESTTTPQWKERFVVLDRRSGRIIQDAIGSAFWHPDSEREKAPAGTYPNWVIAEVNGIKDIYEQSERNDLLRIVKK